MTSKLRRLGVAFVVVALLYGLAGFLIAPSLARSSLLRALGNALVTQPSLGRVRINPFALSVTLENLRVADERGAPVAGFERLYLRFDPLRSLWLRTWTLAELRVEQPVVALAILPDRSLNLVRLLRPATSAADTSGGEPRFHVQRLQVRGGRLDFADRSRQPAFGKSLRPIEFELVDFGTRRDSRNAYSLDARSELGERLSWHGRFTLQPFRSEGELRVGDLRARTLSDFMGVQSAFIVSGGTFAFHAGYRLDAAVTPPQLELSRIGVEARDTRLTDRASGEEALAAGALATRDGAFDLARGRLDLGRVDARDVRVRVVMGADGHLNFERWAKPAAADTTPPMLTLVIGAHVGGLALEFQDRRLARSASIRLRDGRVDLESLSTAPGRSFRLDAACSLGVAGRATLAGSITPSAPAASLALDVRGFDLREIEPYVQAFARLDIARGGASAKGRLFFNAAGARGPLLRFVGDASSSDFLAIDHKVGKDFLAWKQLELGGLQYDALPGRVVLREIAATRPYVRMIVAPDRTTNVQALQVPPDSVPPAFRPVPGRPDTMPVRIELVRVQDGSMYFADLSLTPNFATGIRSLNGTIRELSSAEAAHADVQLDGKVDAYAPVHIAGTLNPLNGRGRTDLGVAFKNIELTTFSPYSGKFMGYRIEKGKLDLDLRYRIQDRQLDATNKVFMRQLTLGEKVASPDATRLPVRFAVALLKDRDGNIDLNLPVKGNLDDPRFAVLPIVMKVLVGLVTKAVASPFALLGAAFGGGDHENPEITFPFGGAELDSTDASLLRSVRKGLADRPALKLEIEVPGACDADSMALLARHYTALLRAAAPGATARPTPAQLEAARTLAPAGFEPGEWVSLLTHAYVDRIGKLPAPAGRPPRARKDAPPDSAVVATEAARLRLLDERLRAHVVVEPTEMGGLARRRTLRVREAILADSTIAPERVFITGARDAARRDSLGVKLRLTLTD